MCWFAINLKKQGKKYDNIKLTDKKWTKEHAEACYESTTTAQRIKELFVEFHEHGIIYGTNDFKKKVDLVIISLNFSTKLKNLT